MQDQRPASLARYITNRFRLKEGVHVLLGCEIGVEDQAHTILHSGLCIAADEGIGTLPGIDGCYAVTLSQDRQDVAGWCGL